MIFICADTFNPSTNFVHPPLRIPCHPHPACVQPLTSEVGRGPDLSEGHRRPSWVGGGGHHRKIISFMQQHPKPRDHTQLSAGCLTPGTTKPQPFVTCTPRGVVATGKSNSSGLPTVALNGVPIYTAGFQTEFPKPKSPL